MQKIVNCLWLDEQAEAAAQFYTSIFKNSRIDRVGRLMPSAAENTGKPVGSVFTVEFQLDGQQYLAFNGGPMFKFNEAMSLVANCDDQAEIDRLWEKLSEGGEPGPCGWLKDKFGLSWQVVPSNLGEMMSHPTKAEGVMQALLKMNKLDIASLQQAYNRF